MSDSTEDPASSAASVRSNPSDVTIVEQPQAVARSVRPDGEAVPPWVSRLGWRVAGILGTVFLGAIATTALITQKYAGDIGDLKLAMAKDSAANAIVVQNIERRLEKMETKLDHWWKPGTSSSGSGVLPAPSGLALDGGPSATDASDGGGAKAKFILMTKCDPATVKVFSAADMDAGAATCRVEGARLIREYGEGNEYLYLRAKEEIADGGIGRVVRWTVSSTPRVECECRLILAEY